MRVAEMGITMTWKAFTTLLLLLHIAHSAIDDLPDITVEATSKNISFVRWKYANGLAIWPSIKGDVRNIYKHQVINLHSYSAGTPLLSNFVYIRQELV